jgi:hypothetical protein
MKGFADWLVLTTPITLLGWGAAFAVALASRLCVHLRLGESVVPHSELFILATFAAALAVCGAALVWTSSRWGFG